MWVGLDYAGVEAWTSGMSTATGAGDVWTQIANLDNIENIFGTFYDDRLLGDSGANLIVGAFGNDVLTGGAGLDTFAFIPALDAVANVDQITDFSVADDTIQLRNSNLAFTELADGALAASAFRVGSAAADADDRIIYDAASGALLYDADGTGGGVSIQFAQVSAGLAISHDDFLVV